MRWTWLGVGLVIVAIAVGWRVVGLRRQGRQAPFAASVPRLEVEPVGLETGDNGGRLVTFRVTSVGANPAFATRQSLRTMQDRKAPISEPIVRSAEIPMLEAGQEATLTVDISRLRPKGQPARFVTEWIHVTAHARGQHDVATQTSWEWRDGAAAITADWVFLRFLARDPSGRILHDEKVPGYDWEPQT